MLPPNEWKPRFADLYVTGSRGCDQLMKVLIDVLPPMFRIHDVKHSIISIVWLAVLCMPRGARVPTYSNSEFTQQDK